MDGTLYRGGGGSPALVLFACEACHHSRLVVFYVH